MAPCDPLDPSEPLTTGRSLWRWTNHSQATLVCDDMAKWLVFLVSTIESGTLDSTLGNMTLLWIYDHVFYMIFHWQVCLLHALGLWKLFLFWCQSSSHKFYVNPRESQVRFWDRSWCFPQIHPITSSCMGFRLPFMEPETSETSQNGDWSLW